MVYSRKSQLNQTYSNNILHVVIVHVLHLSSISLIPCAIVIQIMYMLRLWLQFYIIYMYKQPLKHEHGRVTCLCFLWLLQTIRGLAIICSSLIILAVNN